MFSHTVARHSSRFAAALALSVMAFAGMSQAQATSSSTEVFVGVPRLFSTNTNDLDGTAQSNESSVGFTAAIRLGAASRTGFEGRYTFSRNFEDYVFPDGTGTQVQANVNELTGALAYDVVHSTGFRLSVLGGGGALVFSPTANAQSLNPGITRQTRGTFLYGVAAEFPLGSSFGLRGEYRGLVFKAPDFGMTTGAWRHMAEPAVGIVFHF
jgi:hypothetical protein